MVKPFPMIICYLQLHYSSVPQAIADFTNAIQMDVMENLQQIITRPQLKAFSFSLLDFLELSAIF
jgi:hypothetical protein